MKLIFYLLCCFFIEVACAQDWNLVDINTSLNLNEIHFVSDEVGFIIGEQGLVLKTTDGGLSWHEVPTDVSHNLHTISFANQTTGYINGLKTTDGGNSWELQESSQYYGVLHAIDANTIVAGDDYQSYVFRSTNGGESWSEIGQLFGAGIYTNSFFLNQTTGYFCSWYSGHLAKTTDGGLSWTEINVNAGASVFDDAYSIYFSSENEGVLGANNGAIFKTLNGGATWQNIAPSGISSNFQSNGVYGFSADHFIVVGKTYTSSGGQSKILETTDGGLSWSLSNESAPDLWDVDCTTNRCFAVGNNATLLVKELHSTALVDSKALSDNCVVWPNPVNDKIKIKGLEQQKYTALVLDVLGQKIGAFEVVDNQIDIPYLQTGIYTMLLKAQGKQVITLKFVKQ